VRYGVVYAHHSAPCESIVEWFDSKDAAQKRAEKITRETAKRVSLVEEIGFVHAQPIWSYR